jgi:anti-anti-sigma factor
MSDYNYKMPAIMQLADIQALLKTGEEFLDTHPSGNLNIDLTAPTILNSLTLGIIIKLNNIYRNVNRKVVLKNMHANVLETLQATSLIHVLNVETPGDNRLDTASAAVNFSLQMDFEIYREVGIFHFSGSMLTPHDAELFYNTSKKILQDGYKMLIDMSDLVFIDSMGIGALIKAYQLMKAHKGEIRICGAGDILKELLDRQKLSAMIKIYNTADEALAGWTA